MATKTKAPEVSKRDLQLIERLRACRVQILEAPDGKEPWSDEQYRQASVILESWATLTDQQRQRAAELIATARGRR